MLLRGAQPHTLRALHAYLANALSHPRKPAYRVIELSSPVFHERVWGVPGGASLLRAAGFAEATLPGRAQTVLRLPPDAPADPLAAAKHLVDTLLHAQGLDYDGAAKAGTGENARGGAAAGYLPSPDAASAHRPESIGHRAEKHAAAAAAAIAATGSGSPIGGELGMGIPADAHARREALHRSAVTSVLSMDGLLADAHTASWDEALAAPRPHDRRTYERLSAREIRCCRKCNQGRLAALLGRLLSRLAVRRFPG